MPKNPFIKTDEKAKLLILQNRKYARTGTVININIFSVEVNKAEVDKPQKREKYSSPDKLNIEANCGVDGSPGQNK